MGGRGDEGKAHKRWSERLASPDPYLSYSNAAGTFVLADRCLYIRTFVLSGWVDHLYPAPPTYGSRARSTLADITPPAVPTGASFILTYAERSRPIVIYFLFTCHVFIFSLLMYLSSFSHARPLFLAYKWCVVHQNKLLY